MRKKLIAIAGLFLLAPNGVFAHCRIDLDIEYLTPAQCPGMYIPDCTKRGLSGLACADLGESVAKMMFQAFKSDVAIKTYQSRLVQTNEAACHRFGTFMRGICQTTYPINAFFSHPGVAELSTSVNHYQVDMRETEIFDPREERAQQILARNGSSNRPVMPETFRSTPLNAPCVEPGRKAVFFNNDFAYIFVCSPQKTVIENYYRYRNRTSSGALFGNFMSSLGQRVDTNDYFINKALLIREFDLQYLNTSFVQPSTEANPSLAGCNGASSSCLGFTAPLLSQTGPDLLKLVQRKLNLSQASDVGFCSPTALTTALVGVQRDSQNRTYLGDILSNGSIAYDSFDGSQDLNYAQAIFQAGQAMGTDWLNGGSTVNDQKVFNTAALGNIARKLKDYNSNPVDFNVIRQAIDQDKAYIYLPVSAMPKEFPYHALTIAGYADGRLRVLDPWGRTYWVKTGRGGSQPTFYYEITKVWPQITDNRPCNGNSTYFLPKDGGGFQILCLSQPLEVGQKFLPRLLTTNQAPIDLNFEVMVERGYAKKVYLSVQNVPYLQHIDGDQGYIASTAEKRAYFTEGTEYVFPTNKSGVSYQGAIDQNVEDYLFGAGERAKGMARYYWNANPTASDLKSIYSNFKAPGHFWDLLIAIKSSSRSKGYAPISMPDLAPSSSGVTSPDPQAQQTPSSEYTPAPNLHTPPTAKNSSPLPSSSPAGPAPMLIQATLTSLTTATRMDPLKMQTYLGPISSCSVSPALPSGLSLAWDKTACIISGTPPTKPATSTYQVTANNPGGSSTATLAIKIVTPESLIAPQAPQLIPANFSSITTATHMNPLRMQTYLGPISSCSVSPALPSGLSLTWDATACIISGTPPTKEGTSSFTVSAKNNVGTSSAALTFKISAPAPTTQPSGTSNASPIDTIKAPIINNQKISKNVKERVDTTTFSTTGGPITSCTISPQLPTGFVFGYNSNACTIYGSLPNTPGVTSYTITASNSAGSSKATLTLEIKQLRPVFSGSKTYQGDASIPLNIATYVPSNSGGPVTSCKSSPAMPGGVKLDSNCTLSGSFPAQPEGTTVYTLSGSNEAGSAEVKVTVTRTQAPPLLNPTSQVASAILPNPSIPDTVFTSSKGRIEKCSITPDLPAGLTLSLRNSTCVISGKAPVQVGDLTFTLTASNSSGSSIGYFKISTMLRQPNISGTYGVGYPTSAVAITPYTPYNSGGAITSCKASPSLPAGLTLSAQCQLSGTLPAQTAGTYLYTITAINSAGQSTLTFKLVRSDPKTPAPKSTPTPKPTQQASAPRLRPPLITLAQANLQIDPKTFKGSSPVKNTGGAITNCVLLPSSPSLSVDSITCRIQYRPGGPALTFDTPTRYTIRASNSAGSSSQAVSITWVSAPSLRSSAPLFVRKNTNFSSSFANSGGAVTSCQITPALPSGLALDPKTCHISGKVPSSAKTGSFAYTLKPSNEFGTQNLPINLMIGN